MEISRYFTGDNAFKVFIIEKDIFSLNEIPIGTDIVISSDKNIIRNMQVLKQNNFLCAIFDEAHLMKNDRNKLSIAVKEIVAKHKLALTGTPIQNNLLELWSIFDILMPSYLGTKDEFKKSFSKLFNLSLLSLDQGSKFD